jgi:uncharacterized caspase-like protein
MFARLCAFLCVLTVFASIDQAIAASESRVALVIGNSEYGPAIGKLKNPANDAKLMAETLKGLGFSVDLVLDADQKAMKRAVKSFGAKLRDAGSEATGLFYYAGHGVQVEGTNFLLPVGAEIEAEADVEIESIAADDVMTQMQSAGNAVNLVFLDACRNNPLARTSRSATRGLARLDAPRGSFVGYSTAPGDVAADGDGANSPYALALVQELKTPGISIEEAHRNVRAKVLAESGNKQTPWDSSSLTGAVVLVEKAPEPASQPIAQPAPQPQPQVQQQASVDREVVFWESIKSSSDASDFEAYLAQYPNGTFVALAKNRIVALAPAAPASPQQADVAADAPSAAGKLVVTPEVKAEIDTYLRNVAASGSDAWALAVARDGSKAAAGRCGNGAMAGCQKISNGPLAARKLALSKCGIADCVLIYEGERKIATVDIVVE